jgi:hypothetical protein
MEFHESLLHVNDCRCLLQNVLDPPGGTRSTSISPDCVQPSSLYAGPVRTKIFAGNSEFIPSGNRILQSLVH